MHRSWIVALGFLLAGLGGLGAYFLPVFQTAATSTTISGSLPNLNPVQLPTQPFTVLLLGSDDDSKFVPDRLNTQSMILLRVDPGTKQATMLSIPRDLWVPIPNQGMGKISWGYQFDGASGAVAAVESNFKVHIDDYVWIGLNGLVKLIGSQSCLGPCTWTARMPCSTRARGTAMSAETSPGRKDSSSSCLRSRPRLRT